MTQVALAFEERGFIFGINGNEATITDYNGLGQDLTIPAELGGKSVVAIGSSAFSGITSLTNVKFPASLTSIGDSAFSGCTQLTRASFLGNAPAMGTGVFSDVGIGFKVYYSFYSDQTGFTTPTWSGYQVDNLNPLTPRRVRGGVAIDYYPVSAVGVLNIPDTLNGQKVVEIGFSAFRNCKRLTSVTIPSSVTHIQEFAFSYCTGLTSLTISSEVLTIDPYAFLNCNSLTDLTILDNTTSIDGWLFAGCRSLKNVTILGKITHLGSHAFERCTSLKNVILPDSLTSIGEHAFDKCVNLESIILPDSLTTIGDGSFRSCVDLKSVTIPSGVTSIGWWAFRDCKSLKSVIIPPRVTSLGVEAFYGCRSLKNATFLGNAPILLDDRFFSGVDSEFAVTRQSDASGFDVPPWRRFKITTPSPLPWRSVEIGDGEWVGFDYFKGGTFTLSGVGNPGKVNDRLRFTYQMLSGDGEIIARVNKLGDTGSSSRVGIAIRNSLAPNARYVFLGLGGDGAYRWDRREISGSNYNSTRSGFGSASNAWLRLVRKGKVVRAYKSSDGNNWVKVGSTKTTLAKNCYIGLTVTSGSDDLLNTSEFRNVTVKP